MADPSDPSSHLFLVRVWREQDQPGMAEIRGRVQHVLSGEIRHFRTWRALEGFMVQFVGAEAAVEPPDAELADAGLGESRMVGAGEGSDVAPRSAPDQTFEHEESPRRHDEGSTVS